MTKRKATCLLCEVEEVVPEDHIRKSNGSEYWTCEVCAKEHREKLRTYKMVFMDRGIKGTALLQNVPQEEIGNVISELINVYKGVLLSITEIEEQEEKAKVLH